MATSAINSFLRDKTGFDMGTTFLSCLVNVVNVDIQRLIHSTGAPVAMRA